MAEVGVKELKNRLSEYLARVRGGETITVTSHGRPVAELRAVTPAKEAPEERWDRLVAEGRITPSTKPKPKVLSPPVEIPGGASRFILEEREAER